MKPYILISYVILLLLVSSVCNAKLQSNLIGTWIGISHQTITVTDYKKDSTFSGAYFTPAFDVKTTFSGVWEIDKDILVLNYKESSSPVMRVPFVDKNRLVIKDKNTIILHTYPSGISLECNRVLFKERSEVYLKKGASTDNRKTSALAEPNIYADRTSDNNLILGTLTGDIEMVRQALSSSADINVHEKQKGNTPLILAAFYNHYEIVSLLISSGAEIDARCNEKNTALVKAAWNGSTECAKLLIKAKADINAKEIAGMTPLMIASFYGHIDVVKLLVEAGCGINIQDEDGFTALSNAKDQGHSEIVEFLIKNNTK